jgi:hypothetical protein
MHIHRYETLRNLILSAVLTIGFASSALAQGFSSFIVDLNSKEATNLGTLGEGYSTLSESITRGRWQGTPRLTTGSIMPSSPALMA